MNQTEKMLKREILRLESEKDQLLKILQWEEEQNFKRFEEIMQLNRHIRELERISKFY